MLLVSGYILGFYGVFAIWSAGAIFGFFPKDTLTCRQEEVGIELPALWSMDYSLFPLSQRFPMT